MDTLEILKRFPDLEGLYIPQEGEVVGWGTGCAIVTQSPRDHEQPRPLMVISLNADYAVNSGPFEVTRHLAMGPRVLTFEEQEDCIKHYNEQFGGRFVKLFNKYPFVKLMRGLYVGKMRNLAKPDTAL